MVLVNVWDYSWTNPPLGTRNLTIFDLVLCLEVFCVLAGNQAISEKGWRKEERGTNKE
jgi:hypothetical protein